MRGKRRAKGALATALKRVKPKHGKRSYSGSGSSGGSSVNEALPKLSKDVPQEVSFWLSDGRIIRSAVELADAARTMSDEVYEYHANQRKNDFADWVRDIIKDEELAYAVRKATDKKGLEDAIGKRLKGQLRIEEPERTILEEPVAKHAAASATEPSTPQLARRKDNAFVMQVRKLNVTGERAAAIKDKTPAAARKGHAKPAVRETPKEGPKTIISLPKKTVRDVRVADAVKATKPVEPVEPVVSPAARHNAALKKSAIDAKHSAAAKAAKDSNSSGLGKREAELVKKEKELNEEEQKLNHARVELIRKRYELLKERGALEKEKFERFISKSLLRFRHSRRNQPISRKQLCSRKQQLWILRLPHPSISAGRE
ncbi:hypothetical protein HYU15_04300 [Candidatus Woesearchaeota archaeon]|nr:hypothetical protein [Candidatus Woesearchaeota archaeon]